MNQRGILKIFWYAVWHKISQRIRLIIAITFSILISAIELTIPFILRWIINALSIPDTSTYFITLLVITTYGALWSTSRILEGVREMISVKVVERAVRNLSLRVFRHVLSLSLRYHYGRGKAGLVNDVLMRIQNALPTLFWDLLFFSVPTIIQSIVSIGIIGVLYGPIFSVVLGTIFGFFMGMTWLLERNARPLYRDVQKTEKMTTAYVADKLMNIETVKSFSKEQKEEDYCDVLLASRQKSRTIKTWYKEKIHLIQGVILGIGLTATTLISGYATFHGHLNSGDFILLNGYLFQFITPLNYLGYLFRHVRDAVTDLERVDKVLQIQPEVQDHLLAIPLRSGPRKIVFNQVSFSYDQSRQILKNLSLNIPAGQTVAIVGPTGSGKSTIPRLLFRFYNVSEGKIFIDDQDITMVTQASLHDTIGMVAQDASLFDESLYYNIAYGSENATEEEVWQVIRMAHLESFVQKLPQGLQTVVGSRGVKLSGGEKQRIAIARVLLKKPEIFIFDEATAALDNQTEKEIQANIWRLSRGKTTLIIAHRLTTIVDADKIIVLKDGQLLEEGSHEELLKRKGLYYLLWEKQTRTSV